MRKILLMLFPLLFLIGCGKSKDSAELKNKVTIWAMGDEANKLKEVKDLFEEENPGMELKIQAIPWRVAQTKLLTAISGGTTPDVAQIGTSFMNEYQKIGAFEELDSYLSRGLIKKDDFIESALQTGQFDNKLYGIPWYTETRVVFYRKDIFKEIGYEEFPKNWSEFKEATRKLKERGVKYPFTLPVSESNTPAELYSIIWQNGTDIIDKEGNILVESPEFKEAITYYTDFFREGIVQKSLSEDMVQLFVNGDLTSFVSGPWMINIIKAGTKDFDEKWDIAMLPGKKTQTSYIGGCNFVLFKESKNKEGAFKFIEFISKPENQIKWFKLTNSLPTSKKAWEDKVIKENALVSKFQKQLEDAKGPISVPDISKIDKALSGKVEEIIYEKTDVEEGMRDLKQQIEKILLKN